MQGQLAGQPIRIYGDLASCNCQKVKFTADYLKIPYQWVHVDLRGGDTHTQHFLRLNPEGQVPVVELPGGEALCDANTIILFLGEGTPLLPKNRFILARVHEMMDWERNSHEPYVAVCRGMMVYDRRPMYERETWRVQRSEKALDHMEALLARSKWMAGDAMTLADICLLPCTRLAHEGGFSLERRPRVQQWVARCERMLGLPPA